VALVVVSYPSIPEHDYNWIQAIRVQHDVYYKIIRPHFTFVFPSSVTDETQFVRHIKETTEGVREIPFLSGCALVVKDQIIEYTHVFLIPDNGFSEIVKLHDRLYTGLLACELRLDIPFLPHIGIANAIDPQACKNLADDLNGRDFHIGGVIDTLDVALFDGKGIKTISRIHLHES
jgi:hypothetical protein